MWGIWEQPIQYCRVLTIFECLTYCVYTFPSESSWTSPWSSRLSPRRPRWCEAADISVWVCTCPQRLQQQQQLHLPATRLMFWQVTLTLENILMFKCSPFSSPSPECDINVEWGNATQELKLHINHFKRRLIHLINKTNVKLTSPFYININNIVYEKIKKKIRLETVG